MSRTNVTAFVTDAGRSSTVRRVFRDIPNLDAVPEPVGHRILVQIPATEEKTSGGIIMPDKAKTDEQGVCDVGKVIAFGSAAYWDAERFPKGSWCAEGDIVQFGRYGGHRFVVDGIEYRYLNDDEILGIVFDPNAIARV